MITLEKVHVIPLGFERSVAVKPVRVLGGTKVHIIVIGGKYAEKYELSEEQRYFIEAVVNDLEKMSVEVDIHYADLFDFKQAIKAIAEIVVEEKKSGKEVYLNLSSHGRLVSIASALVGWYHGIRMYYVLANRYAKNEEERKLYGRSVCDKPVIIEVPQVELVRPSEEDRFTILLIHSKKKDGKEYVKLGDIAEKFCDEFPHIYSCEGDEKGAITRRGLQKLLTKLNRRVMDKLESKGYIKREKIGKNVFLKLTEAGEFLAILEASF